MTNDAKYLLWRGLTYALLVPGSIFLGKAVSASGKTSGAAKATVWFILFAAVSIANLAAFVLYRQAKAARGQDARRSQTQIEVETLAAYARTEAARKHNPNDTPK